MADKSPRKTASKKSGKTIKEKRQAKKEKQQTHEGFVSNRSLPSHSLKSASPPAIVLGPLLPCKRARRPLFAGALAAVTRACASAGGQAAALAPPGAPDMARPCGA